MRIPTTSRLKNLHEVQPGHFLIDNTGAIGMCVMWEGQDPSIQGCCYLPLSGSNAFNLAWTASRFQQHVPMVVEVGRLKTRLSFDTLSEATFGFSRPGTRMTANGDLLFMDNGAAICVTNSTRDYVVWLETGRIEDISTRHLLAAEAWSLSALDGVEELFSLTRAAIR